MPVHHIKSLTSLQKIQKMKLDSTDTLVLIYSKNCGPCHMFLPHWKEFTNAFKDSKKIVIGIEIAFLQYLTNPKLKEITHTMMSKKPFVPNVAKQCIKKNRTIMFDKEKSMRQLSLFFDKN